MEEIKRILLECRYLISLNKSYEELSKILKINKNMVYDDLNFKLREYDTQLYQRILKLLPKNNNL